MEDYCTNQGYTDAVRGHTACPFGDKEQAGWWAAGYDKAVKENMARFPRFAASSERRNKGSRR